MDDAGSWATMRETADRRARARRLRREAERASTEWPAFGPQVARGRGPLGEAQELDREIARLHALRARKLAKFAASRPASADRAQGEPGAMSPERWALRPEVLKPVSEWATQEASIALIRSQTRAAGMIEESLTLVQRLPGALAALEGGLLTPEHLRPLLEHVAPIADAQLRAEIEAEVLRWVAGRVEKKKITVPSQLADAVLRVVTRRDARDAAQKALQALRDRGVFRQHAHGEGLAGLGVVGTVPEVEALYAALAAHVDALPKDPADKRTRAQKLLDVLLDLVLRPGEPGRAPVQVVLTLVAGVQTALGGDAPAELNGRIVSAETARQLLNALTDAGLGDGALEELRRIADAAGSDSADPENADPQNAAPDNTVPDPGDDEADDTCFPVPDPFTPEEQALIELSAWFDELPWRLTAGEPDPGEPPEELLAAWPGELDELFEEGLPYDEEAEPEEDVELSDKDLPDKDLPDKDLPDKDLPDEEAEPEEEAALHDPTADGPPGGGAWAAADRAVWDASRAVLDSQAAVGRADWLVRAAARADAADERAWRQSAAGRVDAAGDALGALTAATDADRAALHDLLARTAGGGLAERPRIALVDALSGALVALTDLPGLRRAARDGTALGAPPPTDRYRPGAELDRFIRARDRRCRFPGCRRRVCQGELDHRIAWPEGPTDVTNLAGFCTGDHRGKHQASGFRFEGDPDGTLVVTTPSGITVTTEPAPF